MAIGGAIGYISQFVGDILDPDTDRKLCQPNPDHHQTHVLTDISTASSGDIAFDTKTIRPPVLTVTVSGSTEPIASTNYSTIAGLNEGSAHSWKSAASSMTAPEPNS